MNDLVITHRNENLPDKCFKLIYLDRYDTTVKQFHSYYNGSLNTFVDCEYEYYHDIDDLIFAIFAAIQQYGKDNVTLDYVSWNGNFRLLIAVKE